MSGNSRQQQHDRGHAHGHHDNAFQGMYAPAFATETTRVSRPAAVTNTKATIAERKKKLSIWVRKIIQPNRDQAKYGFKPQQLSIPAATSSKAAQPVVDVPKTPESSTSLDDGVRTVSSSLVPMLDTQDHSGYEQRSLVFEEATKGHPGAGANDNASTAPLFSTCSSSIESSTFSDVHSVQSTFATVFSNKTLDTNSSTVGIPPASILDRGRHAAVGTAPTTNPQAGTQHGAPSLFSFNTAHHTSRSNSMRHFPLHRSNSSRTVSTAATIGS